MEAVAMQWCGSVRVCVLYTQHIIHNTMYTSTSTRHSVSEAKLTSKQLDLIQSADIRMYDLDVKT